MTCVIGLVVDETVHMAADSVSVSSYRKTINGDPKVFRNGHCLIGSCGSQRQKNLLRFELVVPPFHPGEDDPHRYMVVDFIKAVRDCFAKEGFMKKEGEREEGGVFLVALLGGHLFYIQSDFSVGCPSDEYYSIGCGDEMAHAAMFVLKDRGMMPREHLELALNAVSYHNTDVGGPFVFESI